MRTSLYSRARNLFLHYLDISDPLIELLQKESHHWVSPVRFSCFQSLHYVFEMVAITVNTLGTGVEISRIHSISCLDGACDSGQFHLLVFGQGKGCYKALRGNFVIVVNSYINIYLPPLSILFTLFMLFACFIRKILICIDKFRDHLCVKDREELEFYKLLLPWINIYINFWLHLSRYFGVIMSRAQERYPTSPVQALFQCIPYSLIWCTRKGWEKRLGLFSLC